LPRQRLVHVYPDANELGRVFQPALPIVADVVSFAQAVDTLRPAAEPAWASQTRAARGDYLAQQEPASAPGPLNLNAVACHVRDHVPL
ncbi:hypothetical protein NYZ10_19715, partial [Acinetobacter baumannii]|nr:hypothetical protein [Acinetobacter baumannii]